MRVMISAAGSPASVSILRHVRALGHQVIGINAGPETEPLGRAFCDEFYLAPLATHPSYLEFLIDRLRDVDIFLPFIDEELRTIAEQWQRIPTELSPRIAVSGPGVLLDCVDKCRFQRRCTELDLPIAPEVDHAPAFFKPRFGRGGKGVVEARDSRMFEAMRGRDGVMQRAIDGVEYTVDAVFDRNGHLLASAARKRVRAAGVSTIGEVTFDESLHGLAERLSRCWKFNFAINFQAIRDSERRDWIIELNPRLAGSAIFSSLAGCDPFAATFAVWQGNAWSGRPRAIRVWRFWEELTEESS